MIRTTRGCTGFVRGLLTLAAPATVVLVFSPAPRFAGAQPGAGAEPAGKAAAPTSPAVRERIGDVVCAAFGPVGVFQRLVDPGEASLAGHHGSLTSAELLVPWIVVRG